MRFVYCVYFGRSFFLIEAEWFFRTEIQFDVTTTRKKGSKGVNENFCVFSSE